MILSMIEMAIDARCGRNTMMCTQKLGLSAAPPLVCEPHLHGSLLLRARISARLWRQWRSWYRPRGRALQPQARHRSHSRGDQGL